MVTNQLMFQPPLVALMPKGIEPALKVTVCETVVQLCQAPVEGMLRVPYTGVPPALWWCFGLRGPYKESADLIATAKKDEPEYGYDLERILSDRIYINMAK